MNYSRMWHYLKEEEKRFLDKPDVIQGTALRGMFHVWINEGGYESNDTKEISEKRYHLYRGFVKKEITLENAVNEIRENPLD